MSDFDRKVYYNQLSKSPNFGASGKGYEKWWSEVVEKVIKNSSKTPVENSKLVLISKSLIELYSTSKPHELIEGFEALASDIKSRNLRLGAITNGDSRRHLILDDLGVKHFFDFVLTSYEAGCQKPSRQIFQIVLKKYGLKPAEALHIGDGVTNDFLRARKAGWKSILVNHRLASVCAKNDIPVDATCMAQSLPGVQQILPRFIDQS